MLKNFGYAGVHHDENFSVNVILENPADYHLKADTIVFGVTFNINNAGAIIPKMGDFKFYIMDESGYLHNTRSISCTKSETEATTDDDGEPIRRPDALIHTYFKHKFLFQNLRIAFYYKHYGDISIIKMAH